MHTCVVDVGWTSYKKRCTHLEEELNLFPRVMNKLVKYEEKASDADDVDGDVREFPRRLTEVMELAQPVAVSLLSEFEFGEPAPPLPPAATTAQACLTSYLLVWLLVLKIVGGAKAELRPKYSGELFT